MDAQIVEQLAINWLGSQLLLAGVEVAKPCRDHGIDLVAFLDKEGITGRFIARPIQVKAAAEMSFNLDRKYEAFPGLLLTYVWYSLSPERTCAFSLTFAEAVAVLDAMGYSRTPSWCENGRYACSNPGVRLQQQLEPFRMTAERWVATIKAQSA